MACRMRLQHVVQGRIPALKNCARDSLRRPSVGIRWFSASNGNTRNRGEQTSLNSSVNQTPRSDEAREAALRAARLRQHEEKQEKAAEDVQKLLESKEYQKRYKTAARKWTSTMIALPILFVTTYYLFDRCTCSSCAHGAIILTMQWPLDMNRKPCRGAVERMYNILELVYRLRLHFSGALQLRYNLAGARLFQFCRIPLGPISHHLSLYLAARQLWDFLDKHNTALQPLVLGHTGGNPFLHVGRSNTVGLGL